jgi:hypothetical protein
MTVAAVNAPVSRHDGNDVATTFAFNFDLYAAADLVLTHVDTSGTVTNPVLTTDFTVAGVPSAANTITFPAGGSSYATLATGETLTIQRLSDIEEDTDLSGAYQWTTLNLSKDKAMTVIQEVNHKADRSIKRPIEELDTIDMTLPTDRAGKFLGFNSNKEPVVTAGTGSVSRAGSIMPFDAATSVAVGNGTLGIGIGAELAGLNVTNFECITPGAKGITGTTEVQLRRVRDLSSADVMSTKVIISDLVYTANGVIDTANDDLLAGDVLFIDVDQVHSGTAPVGLVCIITVG